MRPATIPLLLFVVSGFSANAQLRIIPQIGLENTRASVTINDNSAAIAPLNQLSPQAALKMDYFFKKQHGPFLSLSTNRTATSLAFSDPENLANSYDVSAGKVNLRLETGYQWSSKRLYFNKKSGSAKATAGKSNPVQYVSPAFSRGHCGHYASKSVAKPAQAAKEKNLGWFVRIQPALGFAYVPSTNDALSVTKQGTETQYVYNAGNMKTAVLGGAGFEFGKGKDQRFIFIIQYMKSVGQGGNTNIVSQSAAKEKITTLSSQSSGWSIKAGIPIQLSKKKPEIKPVVVPAPAPPAQQRKCEYYRRCGKSYS